MQVEFRVLGPLEVRVGGVAAELRGAKLRLLLADLLINLGEVVPVDRLIEDLWPAGAPKGAKHAIEQHVTKLRTALGNRELLPARAPGYVLEADPRSLDAVRFEHLLAEARDAEPARAAARAAEALGLWRGEAYADVAYETFAQGEIARLTELRLEAEEVRIDGELGLGKSSELIGELEALVSAAPAREGRWGQLMRALARGGRQADALKAYQLARRHLVEELGLEPGDELRDLERRILNGDPSLVGSPRQQAQPRVTRRLLTVVAVEPSISLDLDPEEHARETQRAADAVRVIASAYGAEQPEPFVLAFAHEDQWDRATAAAAGVQERLTARIGLATGEALVGEGSIGGPLVARARANAIEGVFEIPTSVQAERAETPFVGRQAELARLAEAQVALVVGTPGIGKTRLARELARGARAVVGHCSSYGSRPLAPLHEIAAALGSPDALADTLADEVPVVLRRLCESAGGPLLVIVDDLQWADEVVLTSLEQLAGHAGASLRVVALARDELLEDRPGFLPAAERLVLGPLPPGDAAALVGHLEAEAPVVERALTAAEGNPLFIEQFVAHASEGGESLPPTLQALLAARLDRLAPSERRAVEHAAVIGRTFDASLLVELVGTRDPLASLVRRGLVEPTTSPTPFEERFRFAHPLIHEAAYSASPRAERSRLHERLGALLADAADDETIGFHLERAATLRPESDEGRHELAQAAGGRLAAAAMTSWQLGHLGHTMSLIERAVALLAADDPQRRVLLCELGVARNTAGDSAAAAAAFDEAEAAAARNGDRVVQLRAQVERAAFALLAREGDAEQLLGLTEEAIPVFEAAGDDRSLGRTLMLSGWVNGGWGLRHEVWREQASRAIVHYRRTGLTPSTCVAQIAAAAYSGPLPATQALALLEELLRTEVEDRIGEASVSVYVGGLEAMLGHFDDAARSLANARAIYEELNRLPAIFMTYAPVEADVTRLAGDDERACAILAQTCAYLRERELWGPLSTRAPALAEHLCALGRVDDATEWIELGRTLTEASDLSARVSLGTAEARYLAQVGEAGEALRRATATVELAEATDASGYRASALVALSISAAAAGRGADADTALERARRVYQEKENVAAAARLPPAAATSSSSAQ